MVRVGDEVDRRTAGYRLQYSIQDRKIMQSCQESENFTPHWQKLGIISFGTVFDEFMHKSDDLNLNHQEFRMKD